MNVNINFSGPQASGDKGAEDTNLVSDAGTAPLSLEISGSDTQNIEASADDVSSESENLDIGGPPEWLKQAMTSSSDTEENVSEGDSVGPIEDGGSGPTE